MHFSSNTLMPIIGECFLSFLFTFNQKKILSHSMAVHFFVMKSLGFKSLQCYCFRFGRFVDIINRLVFPDLDPKRKKMRQVQLSCLLDNNFFNINFSIFFCERLEHHKDMLPVRFIRLDGT